MNTSIKLIFMSYLLIASITKAQQPSIKPYDIDLTNYQYPYPVQFITLNIQGEVLKMAFMDVKPSNANGHVVMLLHGKTSMVCIGDKQQSCYLIMDTGLSFLIKLVLENHQSHSIFSIHFSCSVKIQKQYWIH